MVASLTPEKSAPPNGKRRIRCRICHEEDGHNFRTCPRNIALLSTRPGKRRTFCKKMSLVSPSIQRLKLFTKPIPDSGREAGSEELLAEAKRAVVRELDRLQALVEADGISGFERAWFEASGETELWFNFAGMRDNAMNAHFRKLVPSDDDSFGYNNAVQVVLNKTKPMNQDEMVKTILHEVMHHNVTRGSDAKPLNDNIDHLALALLGDQNECSNFKLGWLCCPFPRCKNEQCLKFDWV